MSEVSGAFSNFWRIREVTVRRAGKENILEVYLDRRFRVDRSDEGISKYHFQPLLSSHHSILKGGPIHVGQTIMVERAPRELL